MHSSLRGDRTNIRHLKTRNCLGLTVIFASLLGISLTGADTDPVVGDDEVGVGEERVIDYAVTAAGAVCTIIGRYPNLHGVVGVMQGLAEDSGFSDEQVGEVVTLSVLAECPEHVGLLQRVPAGHRANIQ